MIISDLRTMETMLRRAEIQYTGELNRGGAVLTVKNEGSSKIVEIVFNKDGFLVSISAWE